jgi:hypothetical protein
MQQRLRLVDGRMLALQFLAAGAVAPLATVIVVLVTLFGALPVYAQDAGRSYAGQGSIAMLENVLAGWKGKLLVLVLLGFAGTDFVITMTLSAADAATRAIENPFLRPLIGEHLEQCDRIDRSTEGHAVTDVSRVPLPALEHWLHARR